MNEKTKNTEIPAPIGQGTSGFESAVTAVIDDRIPTRTGRKRWVICALLFFAATINYVDRQGSGILKPTLQAEFGWTEIDYGWIVFAFQTAYAIGLLSVGRLMDRFGTKKGFSLSIIVWSIAAMAHAWAVPIGFAAIGVITWAASAFGYEIAAAAFSVSVIGFVVARFALGIGEAGNFPASIKTVAEWFPKKERALANRNCQFGNKRRRARHPLLVPLIVIYWGWYEALSLRARSALMARFLADNYAKRKEDPNLSPRNWLYPVRPARTDSQKFLGRAFFRTGNVGFRHRKIMTDPIGGFICSGCPFSEQAATVLN